MMEPRSRHPVGIGATTLMETGINRLRFKGVEDLLGEGAVLIDETGRKPIGGADLILAVQATRASNTFESVILLCRNGRGVQAAMLNRSLFEDVLDVHWVAANPNVAPAMADDHERLASFAERQAFIEAGREGEPLTADERTQLDELLRRYRSFNQ